MREDKIWHLGLGKIRDAFDCLGEKIRGHAVLIQSKAHEVDSWQTQQIEHSIINTDQYIKGFTSKILVELWCHKNDSRGIRIKSMLQYYELKIRSNHFWRESEWNFCA